MQKLSGIYSEVNGKKLWERYPDLTGWLTAKKNINSRTKVYWEWKSKLIRRKVWPGCQNAWVQSEKGGQDKLCICETREIGDSWQFAVWLFLYGKKSIIDFFTTEDNPSCGVEYESHPCSRKMNSNWPNRENVVGECCEGGTYSSTSNPCLSKLRDKCRLSGMPWRRGSCRGISICTYSWLGPWGLCVLGLPGTPRRYKACELDGFPDCSGTCKLTACTDSKFLTL